jgi:bifunctional N-acetylglucosamine-1-phosphate-uridyltransferase/glucosamine-1-phosphate-acetyltransferase GlmU-like protein
MKVILLAAGAGKGFDSENPKPLALVKNKSMILHIIEKIKQIEKNFETIVVIKEDDKEKFDAVLKDKGYFRYVKEATGTVRAAEQGRYIKRV